MTRIPEPDGSRSLSMAARTSGPMSTTTAKRSSWGAWSSAALLLLTSACGGASQQGPLEPCPAVDDGAGSAADSPTELDLSHAGEDAPARRETLPLLERARDVRDCERAILGYQDHDLRAEHIDRCIGIFEWYSDGGSDSPWIYAVLAGSWLELRYDRKELEHMSERIAPRCEELEARDSSCSVEPRDPDDETAPRRSWESCERALEYLSALHDRKTSLAENESFDPITGVLRPLFAGERVSARDLYLDHAELHYSPLTLWKLEHAVFARHGCSFEDADLMTFFYAEERPRLWDEHELPQLQPDSSCDVEESLTENDRANLRLIERARALVQR